MATIGEIRATSPRDEATVWSNATAAPSDD
jgi:hypothetical protein